MSNARNGHVAANMALCATAVLLMLFTRRWESALTVTLPGCVVNWIILRERRLALHGFQLPTVAWKARISIFALPLLISVGIVVFWFPGYAKGMKPLAVYSIASFSIALLLVKQYEWFLAVRRRQSRP